MIGIDMKMPASCGVCKLENSYHFCVASDLNTEDFRDSRRQPYCPLHLLEDQILAGDEVRFCENVGIVTYVWEDGDVDIVAMNGRVATWGGKNVERTGRHFDDVVMMLKKARGEDDG